VKAQTAEVKFAIREYRARDFDRLWQIDQTCFPAGVAYTQMELMGFIARRKAVTLVAEEQAPDASRERIGDSSLACSHIVGFVVALPLRGRVGHVVTLDVVPEARRFGLASRLMEECEQRLRAVGCLQIYLETAVNNEPALQLYRKLGYAIVRTLPGYYSSQSLDAFQMLKHL